MLGSSGIDDMQVGPADATRAHLDADFPGVGDRVRALLQLERCSRGGQYHCAHLFLRNEPALGGQDHTYSLGQAIS